MPYDQIIQLLRLKAEVLVRLPMRGCFHKGSPDIYRNDNIKFVLKDQISRLVISSPQPQFLGQLRERRSLGHGKYMNVKVKGKKMFKPHCKQLENKHIQQVIHLLS